ncbi:MAG: ABC transporter substrate-binding protein [Faecousia sp.]
MKKRILSLILCLALCLGTVSVLAGCSGSSAVDALVIMSEQLDGLFNPFFYTSGADGTIVGMTQIGMLSSKYVNGEVEVAYGDNEAVVVKDYDIVENSDGTTTYTFVLKNGIKFSDGEPLTMEDVLFNYYVYLDPVYTGSNTLYSTDILGLAEYRTQTIGSASDGSDELISSQASTRAQARINELVNLFRSELKASSTKEVSYEAMKAAIGSYSVSSGYKSAISNNPSEVTNANLLADYERALELFREELESDYLSAQESYIDEPYKSHSEFQDEVFCFMYTEGYVEVKYAEGADGKIDRTTIESLTAAYPSSIKDKDAAIAYIYNDKIARELDIILQYWATAGNLTSEFTAKAKEVILHENVSDDGTLAVQNISGIVSLGHTDAAGSTIRVNGTDYTVASGHNADGTVTNTNEYDVLQITINGVDPKAIWNFGLTIAPQHYYGEGSSVGVDIENNKFGVEFASFSFMTDVIQSTRNIKIPVGAGAYKATDSSGSDNPSESSFYTNNVVYFKANENFETVGEGINNAKIEKIRYQIVSSNNAIAALENGTVHYISPSLTTDNYEKLEKLSSKGIVTITEDQLGYGYIGINAGKVNDINLRKAIMCAMNTSLALDYYRAGTASQIYWPMSMVSWAYPKGADATDNGFDYPQLGTWNQDVAKSNIQKYMQEAGVSAGDSQLSVTFTIAGSSLQDHPTYKVFRDAASVLNELGWDVEVVCDTQALTKINTGSLEVWAAAWSSALDPDLYQVYHKDSSATSTLAWGYNYLKTSGTAEEMAILNELSDLIDAARETNDKAVRTELYQQAMEQILELAIELPVYQRSVLYAYNSKVINSASLPSESEMNPYSSPLDRIWEIEFAN